MLEELGEEGEAVECLKALRAAEKFSAAIAEYNLMLDLLPLTAFAGAAGLLGRLPERLGELRSTLDRFRDLQKV